MSLLNPNIFKKEVPSSLSRTTSYHLNDVYSIHWQCPVTITIIDISLRRIPCPLNKERCCKTALRITSQKKKRSLPLGMAFVRLLLQTQQTTVLISSPGCLHQELLQGCSYTSYTIQDDNFLTIVARRAPQWCLMWPVNWYQLSYTRNTNRRYLELDCLKFVNWSTYLVNER